MKVSNKALYLPTAQRDNLQRLMNHLFTLANDPSVFTMKIPICHRVHAERIGKSDDLGGIKIIRPSQVLNVLNEVTASPEGYGPFAGIMPRRDDDWPSYTLRSYGADQVQANPLWQWVFDPRWAYTDNSPGGAANRIRHALKKGIPAGFETRFYSS